MESEKHIDESWKETVAQEKAATGQDRTDGGASRTGEEAEITFTNYITSLILQTLIFLGEIPNPMADNRIEKNLKQAKFLIDTLILLRDKTKGNLTKEEEGLLNGSIYETEMKYVELSEKERLIK